MRISFDLDDTLVCRTRVFPHERGWRATLAQYLYGDVLRQGTCELFGQLRELGHELWIYTTSLRSERDIRAWFWLHRLRVDGVVNATAHARAAESLGRTSTPSKFPPMFGIDLHVDDLTGVQLEGEHYGFRVLVVEPTDEAWAKRVLEFLITR